MNTKRYCLLLMVTLLLTTFLSLASPTVVNPVAAQTTQDWPMFHHDSALTGVADASSAPGEVNVKWRFETGGCVRSSPAVANGKVYVGSDDNNLYCLDGDTGSVVWKYTTGADVWSSPAVVGGNVYFGSCDQNVYCLTTGGALVWKFATGAMIYSSPNVVDGKVYIGSLDYNIYCLNATTGDKIWSYKTNGPIYRVCPSVANGMVITGSLDKKVYSLNATTGKSLWNFTTGQSVGGASAAIVSGKVYIGSDDTYFYCLNATDGKQLWKFSYPNDVKATYVESTPAVYNGRVYLGIAYYYYCLDAVTGATIWNLQNGFIQRSSPAIASDKFYSGCNDRMFYALDTTGKRITAYQATGVWDSSPAFSNSKIYIGNDNHFVYCFSEVKPMVSTTISCSVDPTTLNLGKSLTATGFLMPSTLFQVIEVTYTKPDGTTIAKLVPSMQDGKWEDRLDPEVAGEWSVQAVFKGDQKYSAVTSPAVNFTVTGTLPPTASIISCRVDSSSGSNKISGSINPAVSGATVALTYTRPDLTIVSRTVTTGSDGSYEDTYTPDVDGAWIVTASWDGNSAYTGSTSNQAFIFASTAANTSGALTVNMSNEYVYGIIGAIVLAIIAIIAVLYFSRKK